MRRGETGRSKNKSAAPEHHGQPAGHALRATALKSASESHRHVAVYGTVTLSRPRSESSRQQQSNL